MSAAAGEVRGASAQASEFEARRLAWFSAQGFEGQGRRLAGRLGDTYVVTGGDGTPRRLLIHGGMSEASEWGLLAGPLGGAIAIADRPGCGLSYRIDYTRIDDFRAAASAWVGEVMDGVGMEQADLVANSMGAYFAMAYATENPERVRRLVLQLDEPGQIAELVNAFLGPA
jgi:2-hydroxy-6-oxonona-2,4-dienedioate hydrolase